MDNLIDDIQKGFDKHRYQTEQQQHECENCGFRYIILVVKCLRTDVLSQMLFDKTGRELIDESNHDAFELNLSEN